MINEYWLSGIHDTMCSVTSKAAESDFVSEATS